MWTRFHPIAYEVQKLLASGKLGPIKRMTADFSMNFEPDSEFVQFAWLTSARPDDNRMVDPEQGGGSLLDQGPYPSVWAMLVMHHHPDNKDKDPKVVSSYQKIYERSGVDAASQWIVSWKGFGDATLTTDMETTGFDDACVVVSCEQADLAIACELMMTRKLMTDPPWRPEKYTIVPHAKFEPGSIREREEKTFKVAEGGGMHYEADEVARCIRDGELESQRMPLAESRITQGWLDDVRKAGNTVLKDRKSAAKK